jgi:hypothetical protein
MNGLVGRDHSPRRHREVLASSEAEQQSRRPSPVDDRMGGCRDPEEPHRTQVMPHRENEKSQRQMVGEDVNEGEASAG